MEKYKILMLVLISLFASMSCYADAGITNESFTIFADVVSNGSFYPADSANVTVYLPNSSIFINNKEMINIEIGKFIYNYTPNESGTWYATANFYNSTGDIITVASQSFSVMDNVGDTVVGAFDMILMPFLIILIGILFAVLGQYLKNGMFFVVSGIWFYGFGSIRTHIS